MANTTNFGWETPDDTDLVKDGAAAIRTLAGAIDTSLVDLKGGTTGQVLAKNSNTDMDFVWSADAGIPATIFDAKGDLIAASAADTAARLAVGTNGQVLTADSTASTGLKWAAASSGLTLIDEVSFSGVTTVNINDVFSSTYNNYRVLIEGTQGSPATVSMRYRVSGSDTSSGYDGIRLSAEAGGVSTDNNVVGTDEIFLGSFATGSNSLQVYDIQAPYLTQSTALSGMGGRTGGYNININYVVQTGSTSFTGFTLLCSTAITGKVSIYGYAKE